MLLSFLFSQDLTVVKLSLPLTLTPMGPPSARPSLGAPGMERCHLLENDIVCWHNDLLFKCLQPRLYPRQSRLSLRELPVQLDLLEPEHAPYLVRTRLLVQQESDLFQGQAHIFHRQDAVQARELGRRPSV